MKIGIIGLGSIGQMLVKAFTRSKAASADSLYVYNRTREKAEAFAKDWPFIVCDSVHECAEKVDVLFLCTKPLDILPVVDEIAKDQTVQAHLVSAAAGVSLGDLASRYAGPVSKLIPTVTSQELHGVSLYCCHRSVSAPDREALISLLDHLGKPEEVNESTIETATILTSSAPGLIAGILEQFAQAGTRHTPELSIEQTRRYLVETLLGTATLLQAENLGFDQLIERVATKGGITQEGLEVLGKFLPTAFDEVFAMTTQKHQLLKDMIAQQQKA
ncbi:pyrroline-5-carboxylate reductase [Brevibacillus fluminis]|uniref:Pyrroline-5-carboxylate reductase n=1 Tax=Brevibacillus fluminis TaxID=511487 RepID=A0A3M8DVZ0_9BACL|nr:pyrroline-5-carboxylate reductase dimerization domain-containing protein [Brevibacillus fluminis]RNB92262.1 pyrroline-5-carboxylate reductase [Brevibacillus fluminis]